jgi:Family of unknown function (DUF5678)
MSHEELSGTPDLSNPVGVTTIGEPSAVAQTSLRNPKEIPNEEFLQCCADMDWALYDPEVQQRYAGKYVAVHKKQVLAVGDDLLAVYAEAEEKTGLPRSSIALVPIDDIRSFLGD